MNGGDELVSVAIPIPVRRLFTYIVPSAQCAGLQVGSRVRVPFGRRRVVGTVVDRVQEPPADGVDLRPIEEVVSTDALPGSILDLTRFVSDYYLCSWGDALEAALPPDPGKGAPRRSVWRNRRGTDELSRIRRAPAQRRLLERLPAGSPGLDVASLDKSERRSLATLLEKGWVTVTESAPDLAPPVASGETAEAASGPAPTEAQRKVGEAIDEALATRGFQPFLLYGETGSGKTEVYFRAAESTLSQGRSVIYLVPEIGLTPILLDRVSRRFPGKVAILHSGLGRRQRFSEWQRVRLGQRTLVVGTRSAIFAPVPDLGLVVVDEEQDGSYKQEETPRYNARDMALVRARDAGAAVVLGSATPSLETYRHATSGRYRRLDLGRRISDRPLARVELVDMRDVYRAAGRVDPISPTLAGALREVVERGEQAMILRNRRGWAVALYCPRCGERESCKNCSTAMTWHRREERLRCHHCDDQRRRPERCTNCDGEDLQLLGEGSEQIEEQIRAVVPDARVARMDRDSVRRRGSQERLLRGFGAGEIDVLVGTQMIAKGHDFAGVTLVGVLSADQSLGLPDFRASERTFQLLTQVAGRAGRGTRPGRVVVQAFDPEHPVLRLAAKQNYPGFYEYEMQYREALRYPPLSGLVRLLLRDPDPLKVRVWGEALARSLLRVELPGLLLSGPAPAPLERLQGRYRQMLTVRAPGRGRLIRAVERAIDETTKEIPPRALLVDVDPYSLL